MPPTDRSPAIQQSTSGRFWQWAGPYTLVAARQASMGARDFLQQEGLSDSDLSAWELMIAEASNNLPQHAPTLKPDDFWRVLLMINTTDVVCRITDHSAGFDWPDRIELPEDDSESGRGLYLIKTLSDDVQYYKAPGNNQLTITRKIDVCRLLDPIEVTINAMTEELSYCYESLGSIFHFIDESRNWSGLEEFADKLLQHIITTTNSCCGMIRLMMDNGTTQIIASHHPDKLYDLVPESLTATERVVVEHGQDQWINDESPLQEPIGLVHPFYNEDQLMGILSISRMPASKSYNAGEVSIIHTFSEFLRQHLISERNREEMVRASVAQREFELAANIQQSLLPINLPKTPRFTVAGSCESALSIGGDFYDVIPCPGGFLFVIADVMGKGVAASLIAAITRTTIRCMQDEAANPAQLLQHAASQLHDDLERLEMFVTLAIGTVNVDERSIRIANAGHCPVVISGATCVEIGPQNPPIGIETNPTILEVAVPIDGPLSILAYTDGLTDPRNGHPTFDTQDDVATWFHETTRESRNPEAIRSRLINRIRGDSGTASMADDQTFIVMSIEADALP